MSFNHFEIVPDGFMSVIGILHRETEKAYLIQFESISLGILDSEEGEPEVHDISLEERKFWVPKSQVCEEMIEGGKILCQIKTWLLEKNNIFFPS